MKSSLSFLFLPPLCLIQQNHLVISTFKTSEKPTTLINSTASPWPKPSPLLKLHWPPSFPYTLTRYGLFSKEQAEWASNIQVMLDRHVNTHTHMCVVCPVLSCSVVSYSLWPHGCSLPGSSVHGDSPGKNTEVDCHALLQGIFPIQGWNLGLPHCRKILYRLRHQEAHE